MIVLKSGSLRLLETPESVQACNGVALPFYLTMNYSLTNKKVFNFCFDTNLSSCTYVTFVVTAPNEQWQRVSCSVPDESPTSCIFCICCPGSQSPAVGGEVALYLIA